MGRFMHATGFATLWIFQLQLYGFLFCNFLHFLLATNTLDPSNPPFNNYQAFEHHYFGLKALADTVREYELNVIATDPHAAHGDS